MNPVRQIFIRRVRVNPALLKGIEEEHALPLKLPRHITCSSCIGNQRPVAIIKRIPVTDKGIAIEHLTVMGRSNQDTRVRETGFQPADRIVQGAEFFTKSEIVTDAIIDKIEEIAPLAPVHNLAHVQGLRSAKAVFGAQTPNVVVFDTTFHQTMPAKAYMYGVPYEMYEQHAIRRYGAHGTSHRYVSMAAAKYLNSNALKMVTCHLGNGSSISAVNAGKCMDTSMGLTPLAGVLMGTRSGDLDPSVVTYMEQKLGFAGQEMADYLNKKSGLLGVSGVSSDMRDVWAAADSGNKRAKLAIEMLAYQIKKYIGAYSAAMGGLDCVVFTGGIGENDNQMRALVCENMEYLGVSIDAEKNGQRTSDILDISGANSRVKVLIVCTNEELMIARDTKALVEGK